MATLGRHTCILTARGRRPSGGRLPGASRKPTHLTAVSTTASLAAPHATTLVSRPMPLPLQSGVCGLSEACGNVNCSGQLPHSSFHNLRWLCSLPGSYGNVICMVLGSNISQVSLLKIAFSAEAPLFRQGPWCWGRTRSAMEPASAPLNLWMGLCQRCAYGAALWLRCVYVHAHHFMP